MKKLVKKILLTLSISFVLLLQTVNPLFAAGVNYISADISVICENNGIAHITEVWEINASSGTEMYLGRENLDKQTISNLKVLADGKEYKNVGAWNTSGSLQDKAYKCGIVKDGTNYELCWGLSSYGKRIFNVSYDITNLVKECQDGSFIDQIFINKLPSSLTNAKITIEQKENKFANENTKIWAGGTIGEIFIKDGKIEAKTTRSMFSGSNLGILAQFDKGMFSPEIFVKTTFQELIDKELAGTDYQSNYEKSRTNSQTEYLVPLIFSILPFFLFSALMSFFSYIFFLKTRRRKDSIVILNDKFRKEYKNPDYSRSLPFENNLFAAYARLKSLGKLESDCSIIGVYLLKWIQNHQIELVKIETKKLFKKHFEDAIKIKIPDDNAHTLERELFEMLSQASDENQILRKKDFEKWCRNHFNSLDSWIKKYNQKGLKELKKLGAVVENQKKFLGFINYTRNELSEAGVKYTAEMFGFKKYLEDFTIINEREIKEVELWENYLIYAQMFGIAEQVSKQFRDLYPKYFDEKFDLGYNTDNFLVYMMINNLTRSYARSAQNTYIQRYNSSAGAALSGFGGSFSGGGFGGSSGGGSSGVR